MNLNNEELNAMNKIIEDPVGLIEQEINLKVAYADDEVKSYISRLRITV